MRTLRTCLYGGYGRFGCPGFHRTCLNQTSPVTTNLACSHASPPTCLVKHLSALAPCLFQYGHVRPRPGGANAIELRKTCQTCLAPGSWPQIPQIQAHHPIRLGLRLNRAVYFWSCAAITHAITAGQDVLPHRGAIEGLFRNCHPRTCDGSDSLRSISFVGWSNFGLGFLALEHASHVSVVGEKAPRSGRGAGLSFLLQDIASCAGTRDPGRHSE